MFGPFGYLVEKNIDAIDHRFILLVAVLSAFADVLFWTILGGSILIHLTH